MLGGKIDFILHSVAMSLNVRKKRPYDNLDYDFLQKTLDISAISFHKVLQTAKKLDAINEWGSVVALSYAAHPVPKPFSYYPYGFDKDGTIHYSEYYQNAFSDIYKGKQGNLYECDDIQSAGNSTQIGGVFVCENAVKVDRVTMISNLYDRLMEYQQQGLFRIRPLDTISDKEMQSVYDDLKQTIQKHNLKQSPDNSMSRFIREHFPEVWEVE